eukprot:TRINITY_DN14436_c0_g1_i1.p1 TRINITY_DN14436_c0_g1~~TRINITY_DN14436_c0_g1_i1.p1  ORF type:complete len:275 (+),score=27.42 TRINITY_DN14436_c0_g1_i1:202-1026(+)
MSQIKWRTFILSNLADWICLIILALLELIVHQFNPFHRFIGEDEMQNYKYPYYKFQTVPAWALSIITLLPALLVFAIFRAFNQINNTVFYRAVVGFFASFVFTVLATDCLKNLSGRPRPHYYYRCFPEGNATYAPYAANVVYGYPECSVDDAMRSFPSGHSSISMSGLGFLSLFLLDQLRAYNGMGSVWKGTLVMVPILCSGLIAATRVRDYYHHWGDVLFGLFLGFAIAVVSYCQFFPYNVNKFNSNDNNKNSSQQSIGGESEEERLIVANSV